MNEYDATNVGAAAVGSSPESSPESAPKARAPGAGENGNRNEIGIRSAAAAARKALFFVELMLANQARQVHEQQFPTLTGRTKTVRSLLEGNRDVEATGHGSRFERDEAHCRQQISRILATVPAVSVEDRLRDRWSELQALAVVEPRNDEDVVASARVEKPAPRALDVQELNGRLRQFIRHAIPWFDRVWDNGVTLAQRNLATLAGVFSLGFAVFGVEQIRALFFDQWGCSLWALAIVLPVPVMSFARPSLRWHGSRVSVVRARVNLFWRASARHPLGYDAFSASSGIGRQLMLAAAFKAIVFLTWLAFCALILGQLSQHRVMQTMGWTVCLFAAAGTALALLDYWDFLHPAPIRFLFMVCTCSMGVLYASTDFAFSTVIVVVLLAVGTLFFALRHEPRGWRSIIAVVGVIAGVGVGGMLIEEITDRDESWVAAPGKRPTWIGSPSEEATAKHPEGLAARSGQAWPHPGRPSRPAGAKAPPIVVMAASGGGSRAAVLTALALEQLARTPIPTGNQYASSDPPETFADHLQAISSVSGGSLASAAFLARRMEGRPVDGLSLAVADDYLQPVLLGAVSPRISRGGSLERYWVEKLGLKYTLSDIAKRWQEGLTGQGLEKGRPPLPVPLFNSATLDGHAVVLTPFDWSGYASDEERAAREASLYHFDKAGTLEVPTWVYYRSAIYSLQDLLPGFDPTLAQAVRASANFPFGFPVVQVATEASLPFSPIAADAAAGRKERVRLTDGGVVSNSGLWTLSRLLATHATELQERGVILVLVDGSKMPEYAGRTRTRDLVNTILDQALIAANLHSTMLAYLRERLERHLAVAVVALDPKRTNNVYTSWALDQDTRQQIEDVTQESLANLSKQVQSAWIDLQAGKKIETWPTRLPLD